MIKGEATRTIQAQACCRDGRALRHRTTGLQVDVVQRGVGRRTIGGRQSTIDGDGAAIDRDGPADAVGLTQRDACRVTRTT